MVRYALLALLGEQSDYGYRLKLRFDARVGTVWRLNIGQVYQTLRALERARLVCEVETVCDGEHPARRIFALTPKGRRVLERWQDRQSPRPQPVRDELLIRLLVASPERRDDLLDRLAEQESLYRQYLARLLVEQGREPADLPANRLVQSISLEGARLQVEAHLRWLEHCRQRLAELGWAADATPARAASA